MTQIERRDFLKAGALIGGAALLPGVARACGGLPGGANFVWKLSPPEAGGLAPAGIEGIKASIQKNIDAKIISGAVTAVARRNKLVWYEAQGWSDIDAGKPMRRDSLFHMMSSSKVVTSVAVLMMIEQGKLALDDPISKFIPTFKGQKVAVAPTLKKRLTAPA